MTNEFGPQKGVQCIFPIKHRGGIYYTCMPDDTGCHWCSTKIDENGNHVNGGGFWGCCNEMCPIVENKGWKLCNCYCF